MATNPDPFLSSVQWNPGYGPNGPTGTTAPTTTAPTTTAPTTSSPGFYKYDTAQNGLSADTVYNAQTNQPYSSWNDLLKANNGVAPQIATRQVNVSLNPSTTTDTNALGNTPVTNNDINSLIQQNQQFQQQVLGLMQPSVDEQAAIQQKNDAYNTLNNFDVSLEGGIKNIMAKPIALEFQQGQEAALNRDAAFTRSSLARAYDASVNNLSAIQNQRNQLLQAAQQQEQFGQQNIATQLQLDQIKKQEQAAAIKFALDQQITQPYYLLGQTVYDTASGNPFTSEQDFKQKTGMDVGTAQAKGLIQTDLKTPEQRAFEADQAQRSFENNLSLQQLALEQYKATTGSTPDGLTLNQLLQATNQIQDNARQDPDVNQFTQIRGAFEQARSAAASNTSAGDIILMRTLAKITDPTTGVREEEYRTFQNAIGTLPRFGIQVTSNLVGKGQLTSAGRQELMKQIQSIYDQRLAAYNSKINFYQNEAKAIGGSIPFYTAPSSVEGIVNGPPKPGTSTNATTDSSTQGFFSKLSNFLWGSN